MTYEGTHKYFPIGNRNNGWGQSWWIGLFPFLDQDAVFKQWTHNGPGTGFTNAANGAVVGGKVFQFAWCPSSPLRTQFEVTPHNVVNPIATYTGIAGATPDPQSRTTTAGNGIYGNGGVLFYFSRIGIKDIRDGASNVMAVAEQSDFCIETNGPSGNTGQQRIAINSWPHGMFMGSDNPNDRSFNCTTVRYKVNYKQATGGHNYNAGLCGATGVCGNMGNNNPIQAAHSGGAHTVLCDGTVRFLNESLDLSVFRNLAVRDDNRPLGEF